MSGFSVSPTRCGYDAGLPQEKRARTLDEGAPAGALAAKQGDCVCLSPEAKALSGAGGLGDLRAVLAGRWPMGSDGTVRLSDIKAQVQKDTDRFEGELRGLLAEEGISPSQPFTLTVAGNGKVVVSGSHPQKDAIEGALEDRPELSNLFRKVSAGSSFVRAGEEASQFQAAYAADPRAAVARFAHLFSDSRSFAFALTVGEEGVLASFRNEAGGLSRC